MSSDLLKFLSSVCFGAAATCLGVVAYRGLRGEVVEGVLPADPSIRRAEMRRRALANSPAYAFFLVWLRIPALLLSRLGTTPLRRYVREPYARAAYPGGLEEDELVALGVVLSLAAGLFVGFSAAVIAGPGYAWFGLCALPCGFLGMVSYFQTRAEVRESQILKSMPYVLDLIVLILRSGTSLTIALRKVVADYNEHPVGDELGQVLAEIEMGAPRVESLRRLAERVKAADIGALAEAIAQSEELGWPLADTLERQADRMAAERILMAQSKAGAAGVLVMIPSTLVLLAAIILLFGPILVRFMQGGLRLK
jgi:tight adherence protein C